MVDSAIIQCPVCGELRHKSWFSVGHRACVKCWNEGRAWEPEMNRLHKKLADQQRAQIKTIIHGWMESDSFPEDITADERKILLMRSIDRKDVSEIARFMGIKEARVRSIETRAQAKMIRYAKEEMYAKAALN